jgi:hypothetical protein
LRNVHRPDMRDAQGSFALGAVAGPVGDLRSAFFTS